MIPIPVSFYLNFSQAVDTSMELLQSFGKAAGPSVHETLSVRAHLAGEDDSLVSVRPVLDCWPNFRELLL
jgi:hypothetical protein